MGRGDGVEEGRAFGREVCASRGWFYGTRKRVPFRIGVVLGGWVGGGEKRAEALRYGEDDTKANTGVLRRAQDDGGKGREYERGNGPVRGGA